MDWLVKKANPDTERLHLNRILQDIQGYIDGLATMESVVAGSGIDVDATDPLNPIVSHKDTSSVSNLSSDNSSVTVLQDISFTFDTFGHVTACSVGTVDLSSSFEPSITAGTTAQFWRGDKTWSNTLTGPITVDGVLIWSGPGALSANIGVGSSTLSSITTGSGNTAFGVNALSSISTNVNCTAVGASALRDTQGNSNTAVGNSAARSNTTGANNVAIGSNSLLSNLTGSHNMAIGANSLQNTTSSSNTGVGTSALAANVSGSSNVAIGHLSLQNNTASANVAVGYIALGSNTSGAANVAVGYEAGRTSVSANANTTGSNNSYFGYRCGPGTPTQLTFSTVIGSQALVTTNNTVVLGRAASDFTVIGATGNSGGGCKLQVTGHIGALGAGNGLRVAEGSNAKQGVATLVAGTVTVANTSVTASSRIFLTSQSDGGTPGFLRVSARTAGTNFTITSSSATDTSVVAYEIFEPGT